MNKNLFILFISAILFFSSCGSMKRANDLNYMQSVKEREAFALAKNLPSTIQIGDQLVIFVSAKNMEVVKPFNQGYYTAQITTPTSPPNEERTYLVDSQGNIEFPILGTLATGGRTLEDFRSQMHDRISQYVKDPVVTVRLANFKITVLGEVQKPGEFIVPEGKTTLLNALGLAGDLTIYGKRDNILIVRNENGVISEERLSLLNTNFINSPYFNLKQGDVIYVSANEAKEKEAKLDPNTGTYIAIAGTLIGLAGIFITIFNK